MVVGNGSSAFRAARGKPSAVVGQAPLLRRILFRQSGEDRQLFQILLDRSCGRSPEDYALSTNYFLTGNPALRSKNGSILDAHVVRDSDLPANDDIILYHCAAGETCLRRDHNVLADIDVATYPPGRVASLRADIQQMLQSNAAGPEIKKLSGKSRQ